MSEAANKKRKPSSSLKDNVVDLTCDSDDDEEEAKAIHTDSRNKKRPFEISQTRTLSDTAPQQQKPIEWTMVSYNLWFQDLYQAQRMNALAEQVLSEPPRLVGLQEVTASLMQTLVPLLESVGYQMIVQEAAHSNYGCALALQVDQVLQQGFLPYSNTIMERGLLWALVKLEGVEIFFGTTHLESYMPQYHANGSAFTGAPEREAQLLECRQFIYKCMEKRPTVQLAVLLGDLNWDDVRPRSTPDNRPLLQVLGTHQDFQWRDAWLDTHTSKEVGYTYDAKENSMLGGNLRRRFDRCLVCTRTSSNASSSVSSCTVQDVTLLGTQAIPGLTWTKPPHPLARNQSAKHVPVLPSDHYGLRIQMQAHSK